jgi:hypothetical protein
MAILLSASAMFWIYPAQTAVAFLAPAAVMDCLQIGADGINIGVSIYIDDIACLLLVAAAFVVLLRNGATLPKGSSPAFALLGLMVANFARGAANFGIKPAGNGVGRNCLCTYGMAEQNAS